MSTSRRLTELLRAIYPAGAAWWAWDQALLRSNAAAYFRRGLLLELVLICAGLLAPSPPLALDVLEGAASVVFSLVACTACLVLVGEQKSLLDALIGRPGTHRR